MQDVTYLGAESAEAARRVSAIEGQKLTVSREPGGTVTVVDGTDLDDAALNALMEGQSGVLALFRLAPRVTFRDRRAELIAAGASDVMEAGASDDEFLTRLRALLHLSKPPHVLVVEDEDKIGDWAVSVLEEAGMTASRAATLAAAEDAFAAGPIDALVMDRQLPDGDGLDMVARLRASGIRTPSLIFTALNTLEDRLKGLEEANADDYICKPVHADELRARVRLLLRPRITESTLFFGPLEVNRKDRLLRWRGERLEIRRREGEMLIYLAERAGLPIPQRMIYLDVWGKTFMDVGSNPVTAARHRLVREIKSILKARGEEYPEFIATEGDAYLFSPDPLLKMPA
ncbi:MAG: response regulator transcription factor [Pseudomonadota bacterium]